MANFAVKDLRRPNRPSCIIDPRTHFVKAGGVDHKRVSSTVRFKPIASPDLPLSRLSTTRLLLQNTPNSIVYDAPVRYRDGNGYYYPKNYDSSFAGAMSIRNALEVSRNVPATSFAGCGTE